MSDNEQVLESLFQQIAVDPASMNYLVLADALLERGDPRGELIHVHHAMAQPDVEPTKLATLKARADQLIREHAIALGAPTEAEHVTVDWHLGFAERATVSGAADTGQRVVAASRLLFGDGARLLRRLVLEHPKVDHSQYMFRDLLAALHKDGHVVPATLHELHLGVGLAENPAYWIYGFFDECRLLDDLAQLWSVFPSLRRLRLDPGASFLELGDIRAPELRSFEWVVPYLPDTNVAALAKAQWPKLERFVVWTGAEYLVNTEDELYGFEDGVRFDDEDEEASEIEYDLAENSENTIATYQQLQPLFDHLDSLELLHEVGICNFYGSWAALAPAVAEHAFWKRLRRLDISHARIRADDVEPLVAACRQIPDLEMVVVGRVQASEEVLELFREQLGSVAVQGDPNMSFADFSEHGGQAIFTEQFRYVVTQE